MKHPWILVIIAVSVGVLSCGARAGATPYDPTSKGSLGLFEPDTSPRPTALPSSLNPISIIAGAAEAFQRSRVTTEGAPEKPGLSTAINIVVLLTVIGLVPSIMLMTTCFVRIIIVLGLLKQALGTQQLPPPQVILGLALFMTLLVMRPTIERINDEAITPYRQGEITDYDTLWARSSAPLKDFMLDQIAVTGN